MDPRINTTLVTLSPKHNQVYELRDFRPISCYTTIYKIISKIMAGRISKVLTLQEKRRFTTLEL